MSAAEKTADVVVIGAGVVGAATAWTLAEDGVRVHVLDRGPVNRQGSGTTAGNLHIQAVHSERPGQQVPVDVTRLLPLQRAASDLWTAAEEQLQADIGLRRTGGLTVAETDAEVALLWAKRRAEARYGIPTEVLQGSQLRSFAPEINPDIPAATWCPWDGYANPLVTTPAFLQAAARREAHIDAFRPVTALERRRSDWLVQTPSGPISAPFVINAAGPDVPDIARLADVHLAAQPAHLQMHITMRTRPVLPRLIQHVGQGLSVKQVSTGQVLIGGGWPASDRPGSDGHRQVSLPSIVGNVSLACRIVPTLGELDLLRVWTGPVLATGDEMPVIGEVPGCPGLIVCGGTYAFTLAPLWAQTLSCLVQRRPTPVPVEDLGPARLVGRRPVQAGTGTDD